MMAARSPRTSTETDRLLGILGSLFLARFDAVSVSSWAATGMEM
jgi:DNA-binding NarL/FixJ family response regulator